MFYLRKLELSFLSEPKYYKRGNLIAVNLNILWSQGRSLHHTVTQKVNIAINRL